MSNSTHSTRSTRATRATRAALLATGLGIAGATALAVPAQAQILDTDRPRVTATHHDFGKNWALGAPVKGGTLTWDLTNGLTTARITGYHYLTDQECGRVRFEYYDASHSLLGSRQTAVHCAPGNGKTQWWVDKSFASTTVTHVHVVLQKQKNNGSFSTKGTAYEDFN